MAGQWSSNLNLELPSPTFNQTLDEIRDRSELCHETSPRAEARELRIKRLLHPLHSRICTWQLTPSIDVQSHHIELLHAALTINTVVYPHIPSSYFPTTRSGRRSPGPTGPVSYFYFEGSHCKTRENSWPRSRPDGRGAAHGGGTGGGTGGGGTGSTGGNHCECRSNSSSAFYGEDDIAKDEEDWGQKRCPLKNLSNIYDFYNYVTQRRLDCEKLVMLGGRLRNFTPPVVLGEKWVCLSPKFNVKPRHCIVYSFGISSDWTFDDDISTKYQCKVYAFDHTIGLRDHNRSPFIQFFNMGISNRQTLRGDGSSVMDRYVNILKMLGHEHSTLDYLKLDIEGSEPSVFQDIFTHTPNLLKNVKMISMEIHINSQKNREEFWKYFQLLDCFGFKVMFSEINPVSRKTRPRKDLVVACCYEVVWARDRQW
ncbi:probable methyltransferase-like protein 24 [Procambarus clarkii]|uniref:probable methyltransferase-like protein 24 n=1 Tax=Procambarus clarkii TaxID=6728 RepID=UPI0037438C22